MSAQRTRHGKAAVTVAACCAAWVAGATLVYRSGGLNPAGLVPSLGCLVALWGAVRSDTRLMWFGTAVVAASAVTFVFSIGLVVAPAAVVLVVGSLVLARGRRVGA
ncbi:MAG TPA: hypothetical protein VLA91_06565 [Acidimicrobiia bacterium]|nr:hypothetical protein [Acidimicrobiia bacterium]